ncbi:MAG: ABC transporter substrate-binding protein [Actinomycetota bacterium]
MRGGSRIRRPRRWLAATVVVGGLLAGCTDGGETTPPTTIIPGTTVPPEPRVDDGVLRLGVLLPSENPLVADAIDSTVRTAVDSINQDGGGVLGSDVDVIAVDEGGSTTEATQAVTSLVESGVDAIIGPITSTYAVTVVDIASTAGVATCSPTATAGILDEMPDEMLFFRTIASDSMQATAIAETAENTGARSAVVAHVDDAFGRPYADAVATALDVRELDLVDLVGFTPGVDVADAVETVGDTDAEVLIVLASGPDLASFLTSLGASNPSGFETIITNDAIRTAANQPVIGELPSALRTSLIGVAPQILDRRDDADRIVFAPQITDCVTLLGLSAVQANSDDPLLIAAQMPPVSSGGRTCRTFQTCATLIEQDRQVDYNGPTGLTELNRVGETVRAWFERFTFDADGTDRFEGDSFPVSI